MVYYISDFELVVSLLSDVLYVRFDLLFFFDNIIYISLFFDFLLGKFLFLVLFLLFVLFFKVLICFKFVIYVIVIFFGGD